MTAVWNGARWPRLAGVGLAMALAACGNGGSSTTPTTTPTTTTPTTTLPPATVISQGTVNVQAKHFLGIDLTSPKQGTLDITVNYTFDDSQILVWLTNKRCSYQQFENDQCDYLAKSLEGPRPRKLSVPGVPAGDYSLFIADDGPRDEQVTYQIALTPVAGAGQLTLGPPSVYPRH